MKKKINIIDYLLLASMSISNSPRIPILQRTINTSTGTASSGAQYYAVVYYEVILDMHWADLLELFYSLQLGHLQPNL